MVTQKTRDKMRNAHIGKFHSEETKQKLRSLAHNRGPMSQTTKAKISRAMLGHKHTEATKQKLRERLLERAVLVKAGVLPAFHHSEETKEKLRKLAQGRKPSQACLAASTAARKEKAFLRKMKRMTETGFFN